MEFLPGHTLSLITYTPLVGVIVLLAVPIFKTNDTAVKWVANAFGLLGFIVSLPLWTTFDRTASNPNLVKDGFPFTEKFDWIPSIGVQYYMGVDGVSALLILLTTL